MTPVEMASPVDYSAHSAYSDPGPFAQLLDEIEPTIEAVSSVARNLIVHYRASGQELPEESCDDIELRWIDAILATDQLRHSARLSTERSLTSRVQGCCRDHTLLAVAALRHHAVPARSRIGFATYLSPTWNADHVVVQAWIDGRWRSFDPEIATPRNRLPDPTDIAFGPDGPFLTASQAWVGHRQGSLDVTKFGVAEGLGIDGEGFVYNHVIREVAHRFKDELLLWDEWGAMGSDASGASPSDATLVDEVADLCLLADQGDRWAERELLDRYREDVRLRPGDRVQSWSPTGRRCLVDLSSRETKVRE